MRSFDLDSVASAPTLEKPGSHGVRTLDLGSAIGADLLGGTVAELLPGARAWPYHWEAAQEEWLIVMAGTVTVRTPDGDHRASAGEVLCFPVGPGGAHELRNTAETTCRVVLVSNRSATNVVAFPDAGRVGVRTAWLRRDFQAEDGLTPPDA